MPVFLFIFTFKTKHVYKTFLLLALILITATASAQNKKEAFKALEAICNETKGMTQHGNEDITIVLGGVAIKKKEVILNDKDVVNNISHNNHYTNIPWQNISSYSFTACGNKNILKAVIVFDGFTTLETHLIYTNEDGTTGGDGLSMAISEMTLYIPAGKQEQAKKYLDIIRMP